MSFTSLLTHDVTVQTYTAGSEDEYGNVTDSWVAGATYRGRLEQTDGREIQVGQTTEIADWLLFLPADVSLTGQDRVVINGQTFTIVGPPEVVYDARSPHHIEVHLRSLS